MSPPDTNLEKQQKRHKPALSGMTLVVIFVAILAVIFVAYRMVSGNEAADQGITVQEPAVIAPSTNDEVEPVVPAAPATE